MFVGANVFSYLLWLQSKVPKIDRVMLVSVSATDCKSCITEKYLTLLFVCFTVLVLGLSSRAFAVSPSKVTQQYEPAVSQSTVWSYSPFSTVYFYLLILLN